MTDTTTNRAVDQATGKAADELIAVTGDKSIGRLWDLGDSIVAAVPGVADRRLAQVKHELEAVRRHAIDKAGHEDFWSAQRLRQIGNTAARWPKADRVPDVSIDAHMEALKADDPKKLLEDLTKAKGKAPSIREVRDAIGANGGTKATRPPTLGKQSPKQLYGELVAKRDEVKDYLRGQLKQESKSIALLADMFADLKAKSEQVSAAAAPAPKAAAPAPKPSPAKKTEDKKRKGRVKGI